MQLPCSKDLSPFGGVVPFAGGEGNNEMHKRRA